MGEDQVQETKKARLVRLLESSELQRCMILLLIIYIVITVVELFVGILHARAEPKTDFRRATNVALTVMAVVQMSLILLFPLERILRASFTGPGLVRYFRNYWNVFDFFLIFASAAFDIAEYMIESHFLNLMVGFLSLCILRAPRTLFFYHRAKVRQEQIFLHSFQQEFESLSQEYQAKAQANSKLRTELETTLVNIDRANQRTDELADYVLSLKGHTWDSLVPISSVISYRSHTPSRHSRDSRQSYSLANRNNLATFSSFSPNRKSKKTYSLYLKSMPAE